MSMIVANFICFCLFSFCLFFPTLFAPDQNPSLALLHSCTAFILYARRYTRWLIYRIICFMSLARSVPPDTTWDDNAYTAHTMFWSGSKVSGNRKPFSLFGYYSGRCYVKESCHATMVGSSRPMIPFPLTYFLFVVTTTYGTRRSR